MCEWRKGTFEKYLGKEKRNLTLQWRQTVRNVLSAREKKSTESPIYATLQRTNCFLAGHSHFHLDGG